MSTRAERISRATDIIRADPNISKRSLQTRLKAEFGVGLSDTIRRELLRRENSPGVLRQRVDYLTRIHIFTHHDRTVLKQIIRRSGNAPYVVKVVNDFWTYARDLYRQGLTFREIRRAKIEKARDGVNPATGEKKSYIANQTTRTRDDRYGKVKGSVDWWDLVRDTRDSMIPPGDYIPKPKAGPRTDKGRIKDQKVRYREKQTEKLQERWREKQRTNLRKWIEQKNEAIAVSTGDRRKELERQRGNLERYLESLG